VTELFGDRQRDGGRQLLRQARNADHRTAAGRLGSLSHLQLSRALLRPRTEVISLDPWGVPVVADRAPSHQAPDTFRPPSPAR